MPATREKKNEGSERKRRFKLEDPKRKGETAKKKAPEKAPYRDVEEESSIVSCRLLLCL